MADALSTNRQITLIEVGASSNTWGTKLNDNFDLVDAILGDTTSVATTGGTTTLTATEENVAVVKATGVLAAPAIIAFSGRRGVWLVQNDNTGSETTTFKVTGQTGIALGQGEKALVYCNGTDIVLALTTEVSATSAADTIGGAWASEASASDSATPDIGAAASYRVTVAGTTTITGFATAAAGIWRIVRWSTSRTLTYNASTFILRGGVSRSIVSGDFSMFRSEGAGVWREEFAGRGVDAVGPPSSRACFRATLASDQSVGTASATKVTIATEAYDIGSFFGSNKWTPPAGKIRLFGQITSDTISGGSTFVASIRKNGSRVMYGCRQYSNGGGQVLNSQVVYEDDANGTDYYELYTESNDSSYTVESNTDLTFFCGTMI